MYKDKQREADKIRQRRYRRDKQGVTNQGMINRYTKQKALLSEGVKDV